MSKCPKSKFTWVIARHILTHCKGLQDVIIVVIISHNRNARNFMITNGTSIIVTKGAALISLGSYMILYLRKKHATSAADIIDQGTGFGA